MDLATFPFVPSSSFRATIPGEALGEKDIGELAEMDQREDDEYNSDVMIVADEAPVMEEEQLYDPDDDIED